MDPTDPDFDWVTARHQCSLHFEFEKLKRDLERNTKTRRDLAPVDRASEVAYKEDGNTCSVIRGPLPPAIGTTWSVTFNLKEDRICVSNNFSKRPLSLTLTLNDYGECRFQIDGEGAFLRWQVIRRALESIFFDFTPTSR